MPSATISGDARVLNEQNTLAFFDGDGLATDVFLKKYAVTKPDGTLEEYLPSQMWERMARAASKVEENQEHWYKEFLNVLTGWKAVPQGSIMFALGNPYQRSSCSNCFVVPIHEDSLEGIFDAAKEMAKTYAYRGGVGIDISPLRPANASVSNAARTSTGAWSFMDFYSYVTRLIGQHGRRGALMLTINDSHPDLVNFIQAKTDLTKVTGANVSIKISDAFMNAVEKDLPWVMEFETTHEKIVKEMPAKDIWHILVECATNTAEPGILFWDNILRESPADCYSDDGFETICTNPCVTSDTWIMTSEGPMQVKSLVGQPFSAVVDGESYKSSSEGFFFTGTKPIVRLETDRGFSLRCTEDHKIKVVTENSRGKKTFEWIEASSLKEDDLVNLNSLRQCKTWEADQSGPRGRDCHEGWLSGYLLGDGTFEHFDRDLIDKEDITVDDFSGFTGSNTAILTFWGDEGEQIREYAIEQLEKSDIKTRSDCGSRKTDTISDISRIKSATLALRAMSQGVSPSKDLNESIELGSSDFYIGFLRGWLDADGTVLYSKEKASYSVRLSSTKLNNLHIAQRMLARLGIISTVYPVRKEEGYRSLPDGKGGNKDYYCNANHELVISRDNLVVFSDRIGFGCKNKQEKLEKVLDSLERGPYKETFTAKVVSVTPCGIEDVYDATIEDVHEFDANGISVHNCSEIPLPAYDACTLLSMNLTKYTRDDFDSSASFDFEAFGKDTATALRFLDNVKEIDLSLMPLQQQREIAALGRRVGMGTNGLGDTLARLRLRYDSDEAIDFVDRLYEFFAKTVYQSSVDLATEKGAFPIFDAEKEKDNPFLKRIGFAGIPRRNIALLTCAPTGSLSMLCQTSSGVEPVFRNFYTRRRKITHNEAISIPKSQLHKDKIGDVWQEYDVAHHNVARYLEYKKVDLDIIRACDVALPEYFVESDVIDWRKRVKIQATMQKWVDHAISSTCNLPKGTNVETVKEVYEEAYRSGCKGFTVYVDGCRDGVLISNEEKSEGDIVKTDAPKRPKTLESDVHHVSVKGKEYFVTVGLLNGEPYEVFAGENGFIPKRVKKADISKIKRGHYTAILDDGGTIENISDHVNDDEAAITRLISLSLRHGADICHCVSTLEKVPGDMHNFARSLSRTLKKYIPDGTEVTGVACGGEGCESKNLARQEGCVICLDCGWSGCS